MVTKLVITRLKGTSYALLNLRQMGADILRTENPKIQFRLFEPNHIVPSKRKQSY